MENESLKHTKSAGGVVVNKNGQIAVVLHGDGTTWTLPKGHIDEGESELEAAKREGHEESGIKDLEFVKKLGKYQRYAMKAGGADDTSETKTIVLFLFRTSENKSVLKPVDSENPEARWVAKDKVADLLTHSKDKEFFLRVMKEI